MDIGLVAWSLRLGTADEWMGARAWVFGCMIITNYQGGKSLVWDRLMDVKVLLICLLD